MKTDGEWRELARRDDLHSAGVIVTTIAAMEFDAVLRNLSTGLLVTETADESAIDGAVLGPFAVEVRAEDWNDLQGVVEEIVDEQRAFDAMMEARADKMHRARRGFLLVAILAIAIVLLILLSR